VSCGDISYYFYKRKKTKGALRKATKVFFLKWRFLKETTAETIRRVVFVPGSAVHLHGK
jgi:hypothetical protein